MSPDIEWRVGETDDQEFIANVKSPAPPRWRRFALWVVVILGVGLGITYASIPEPPRPPPTPTPRPTVITAPGPTLPPVLSASLEGASLAAAIEHDALALANHAGDDDFDLGLALDDDAEAVIGYIPWRYGDAGVIDFLHALGRADSLPTAIERGLGVTYSEFYIEWLKWLGQRT